MRAGLSLDAPPFGRPPGSSALPPPIGRPSGPSSMLHTPPPMGARQPSPILPRPPERTTELASSSRTSPPSVPRPSSSSAGPSSGPLTEVESSSLMTGRVAGSSTILEEEDGLVDTFEGLLETARAQCGRWAYQNRPRQDIPPIHHRRYKASVVSSQGRTLGSNDLSELSIRVAVIGTLKREFGALEKVAFEQVSPSNSFSIDEPHLQGSSRTALNCLLTG